MNTWRKISMIAGGLIGLALVLFNLYHAVRVTRGIAFTEGLLPELFMTLIIAVILLLPAFAMWRRRVMGVTMSKIAVLYPILVGLGFINILVSDDALAAGLPMVLVVMPFCIIFGLIVLIQGKRV